MKAFIVDRYGKNGALRFGDMPEPTVRDDDILVEIHAAGLNQLDSKIRDGACKATFRTARVRRFPTLQAQDCARPRFALMARASTGISMDFLRESATTFVWTAKLGNGA